MGMLFTGLDTGSITAFIKSNEEIPPLEFGFFEATHQARRVAINLVSSCHHLSNQLVR